VFNGEAQTQHKGGISVEIGSHKPLRLHIVLRPNATKRVSIYRDELPWATRNSMVWIAVTLDGECLEKMIPVEDGAVGRLSLEAGQVLSGDVDLEGIFRGLDEARKKSDVHLFWAYKAPRELTITKWSGGWVLLPQDKTK
jgi:hypothetical protein